MSSRNFWLGFAFCASIFAVFSFLDFIMRTQINVGLFITVFIFGLPFLIVCLSLIIENNDKKEKRKSKQNKNLRCYKMQKYNFLKSLYNEKNEVK